MKRPSPKLHELIKSMTKSEKRYFKQFTKIHGSDKKYTMLFDAIEKQDQYDEEELKQQLQESGIIKHLSSEKNYLYQLILKALNTCYSDIKVETEILEYRKTIEILKLKGLYQHAIPLLEKAKKKSAEHELHEHLQQLTKKEIELYRYMWDFDKVEEIEGEYNKIKHQHVQNAELEDQYRQLNNSVYNKMMRYHIVRQPHVLDSLEQQAGRDLYQSEPLNETFTARKSFLTFWLVYHYLKQDYNACLTYNNRLLALFDQYPKQKRERIKDYVKALTNEVTLQTRLKTYGQLKDTLDWAQNIKEQLPLTKRFPELRYELFQAIHKTNLVRLTDLGQFQKARQIWENEVEPGLSYFTDIVKVSDKMDFLTLAHQIYFANEAFEQSLHYVNQLLEEFTKTQVRYDLFSYCKIMVLIIHYELDNRIMVANSITSTYRYLKRKENMMKSEQTLLRFLRKTPDIVTTQDELAHLKELRQEILELRKDPQELLMLEHFNYIDWIDSKLTNRPFANIVREGALQRYQL
ncbi:MAG: hypothetical protein BRD50_05930 [Bacteroidetes bacterium SW_11_45_7]|nr:MAG: hypothetical protein BRD50_05930 [Bacteroidetes bacterium SW_11_45_7]